MKICYSPTATDEMAAIHDYLCDNFGLKLANEKIAKILEDIERLGEHPFMGRSVDGNDQNLRRFYSAPNMIIYDICDDSLEILHVVDSRTDYIRKLFPKK